MVLIKSDSSRLLFCSKLACSTVAGKPCLKIKQYTEIFLHGIAFDLI